MWFISSFYAGKLSSLFYIKVIVVYHGLFAVLSHCITCLFGVTIGFTYAYGITFEVDNTYDVVFFKFSFNINDADG